MTRLPPPAFASATTRAAEASPPAVHTESATPRKRTGASAGPTVMPLARALSILSAFTPQEPWLGNQEIALETGIPAPTVSRMLRSLVALGYLRHAPERRKYRLAASR